MESMRRSEANSSHHPNKVAVNSLATESNKQSSGSGSLNNNKLSFNQQQQSNSIQQQQQQQVQQNQQKSSSSSSAGSSSSSSTTSSSSSSGASTSSESKDTNFEYDDNEWDVGGIGDLIIDLDADIEKSSSTAASGSQSHTQQSQQQQQQQPQQSQQQLSSSLSAAISGLASIGSGGGTSGHLSLLNANEKSPGSSSSSSSSSSPTTVSSSKSSLSSLFSPISLGQSPNLPKHGSGQGGGATLSGSSNSNKPGSKQSSKGGSSLKLQQSALVAQLNSTKVPPPDHQRISSSFASSGRSSQGSGSGSQQQGLQVDRHSKLPSSTTASMSSQPSGGQGAGKTATKMSIDHQATLDKGLKMKIKRTKPGTKTSEAKHEIVKAEQNGTSSSLEENSSISSNSSSGKKHNQVNTGQSVQSVPTQQATKRGSSSHRRDKTRDKTPHSREKSEHSSNSSSGSSGSSGSNNSNSSSNSHSNNSSNNDRSSSSSSSTTCSCSHELQVNGVQPPCTNISCIRNRTSAGMDQPSAVLAQRIAAASAGQTNSSGSLGGNSTGSATNLSVNSSTNNSSNVFSSNNSSGNAQTSSSGTPNAPGPPKEGKVSANAALPNHQQSAAQLSNSSSSTPSAQQQQQQQQQQNQSNLGPSSGVHNSSSQNNSSSKPSSGNVSISATVHHTISVAANSALAASVSNCDDGSSSPPAKRPKCDPKEMVDICVGTSVGTITEPDCLGPCEPGTSVTLEGIVWHETEGGVLVVNVTWRGKTYVGTLLDCTRHDWAPPRFCDSPTEELDSRTPKGRGKRGRSAALTPDLSNFTETRSSVHSKLRNGGAKGRGGRGVTTASATSTTTTSTTTTATGNSSSSNSSSSATNSNTPSTSPTAFLPPRPEKRKSKDESPSPVNGESGSQSSQTQSLVNPVTGLNVQISTKKCKTASPCAISPVLLECPEQDCSKKYKHANGLRYHQSHAHGSGSMDEDSLQLPESPRVVPPTTPSPAPATTPQPQVSVPSTPAVPPNPAMSNGTPSGMPTTSTTSSTTCAPSPSPVSVTTQSSQPTPVVSVSSGGGLLTTVPSSVAAPQTAQPAPPPQTPPQIPQHTIPGGSITAGISGQALSQHQQQHPLLVGAVPGSNLLQSNNPVMSEGGAQPPLTPQQQQQQQQPQTPVHVVNSSMPSTPTRGEPPGKIKPGVLRFGPPSDNLPPSGQNLSSQSPLRPTPTAAMAPNSGPPSTPESAHQPNYSQPPPQGGQQQGNTFPEYSNLQESLRGHPPPPHAGVSVGKPQNYGKQKKNRKSPVPGDFDNSTSRDDVQSPAYSDISDDSTPVVEPEINDKSQSVKHPDVKKPQDGAPPQMPPLGGYGMYQFYSQQPYMVPPEHQPPKPPTSQSSLPPSSPAEYSKNKEPPLDLMTKPAQQPDQNPKEVNVPSSGGPTAPNPSKPMSHFYPFNYMPPGYSYNMDPNYGPVSMVSDETKMGQVQNQPPSIKEERTKESPSPHDHAKMSGQVRTPPTDYGKISVGLDHSQQMMPTKLIKNEEPPKQIKVEPSSHPMHPKEPPVQSLGAYPSIYQRHSMGVPPQPQQHMSREEELRRYYIYPDQRRSNPPSSSSGPNVPSSVSVKEEPPSPSQSSLQHPSGSLSQNQQNLSQMPQSVQSQQPPQSQNPSQQKSSKSNLSSSQPSSGQKATNLIKDSKDEKESNKVKQEGQKPTMETQGPPPPPTSQYFLHPSYISPGPFGFDPGHPMYRNVLMSTGPYNTPPYHLPMARFHAPEDLSRNPGTKALDALHHAASQYYNSHKIHELSERALKSPTSGNVKVSVSSPNVSQQSGNNSGNNSNGGGGGGPGGILPQSSASGGPLNLQPPTGSMPPGIGNSGVPLGAQKGDGKSANDPTGKAGVGGGVVGGGGAADSRSPPPQRHVHTHHHTHVGLGYPMYPAPYGAAVLASQQAAAVAVINPFPPGPTK